MFKLLALFWLLILLALGAIFFFLGFSTIVPSPDSFSSDFAAPTIASTEPSIADIAVADGRFTTLVAAVEAAGLTETLASPGSYTVFAPTDDAFAALPAGTVEGLLEDIPTLSDILLYHVLPYELPSSEVVILSEITMLNGDTVQIRVEDGRVFVNQAEVIITDIQASNGIIHVIDAVLIPAE
jgi:uncharacterized surface protein with fasciclin (FAS1) repeats